MDSDISDAINMKPQWGTVQHVKSIVIREFFQ
jgi:hypothetical protein